MKRGQARAVTRDPAWESGAAPPGPSASAPPDGSLVELAGLANLPPGTPLMKVEAALRNLARLVASCDPLRRAVVRGEVVAALKAAEIASAARLADAALGLEQGADGDGGQGRRIEPKDPEPWPEPVDGAALLDELADVFRRHLVLPDGAPEILAVWCASTYCVESFDHAAYLAIVSPTKRCGKTTALRLVSAFARRAVSADSISPAALYRVIEELGPTLVVDELDRVPRDSDLWPVLNSGHSRGGTVLRCVGDDSEPRAFSTFGAKVLAYIRDSRPAIPDTVEDRSIRILMQRRGPNEPREKLRSRALEQLAPPLCRKLARWAQDVVLKVPNVPHELDDRAADTWEGLLAFAEAAGGRWLVRARQLAVRFSADRAEEETEAPGVLLLADLRELLESGGLKADKLGLAGEGMVVALRALSDRPWVTWGRAGDGLTPHALGRLLRPFEVRSVLVGPEGSRVRRYRVADVRGAAERFRTKRTSAQPPETAHVSDSAGRAERMSASEARSGWPKRARSAQRRGRTAHRRG